MYVRAGRPAFAQPYVGVLKNTSLMSLSLLLQQCPACLVRLTWIVFVIGGRWPYSWCLVGCCRQYLFKIARSKKHILVDLQRAYSSRLTKRIFWSTYQETDDKRVSKESVFSVPRDHNHISIAYIFSCTHYNSLSVLSILKFLVNFSHPKEKVLGFQIHNVHPGNCRV